MSGLPVGIDGIQLPPGIDRRGIVIVLTMTVTVYHRLRAAATGERLSRKEEGYLFAAVLRGAGLMLWISTLAYLISPAIIRWAAGISLLLSAVRICPSVSPAVALHADTR